MHRRRRSGLGLAFRSNFGGDLRDDGGQLCLSLSSGQTTLGRATALRPSLSDPAATRMQVAVLVINANLGSPNVALPSGREAFEPTR